MLATPLPKSTAEPTSTPARGGRTESRRPLTPAPLLQRGLGNQAMLRLRSASVPAGAIQTKLVLGSVDDPLEREADRVADRVMRTAAPTAPALAEDVGIIRRRCEGCAEEAEEEEPLRRKESSRGEARPPAPGAVHQVVASPGRPLDTPTRGYFEPRFGRDFGGVRVHDDTLADASARSVNATAYTAGAHIVFRRGAFSPSTTDGRWLLAHELAHVDQQSGSAEPRVQRQLALSAVMAERPAREPEVSMIRATEDIPSDECWNFVLRDPAISDVATGISVHFSLRRWFRENYGDLVQVVFSTGSKSPTKDRRQYIGNKGQGLGYPDLAFLSKTLRTLEIGEIKAANPEGVIEGTSDLDHYLDKGNADEDLLREYGVIGFSPMEPWKFPLRNPFLIGSRKFFVLWCKPGLILYKEIKPGDRRRRRESQTESARPTLIATIAPGVHGNRVLIFNTAVSPQEASSYVWGAESFSSSLRGVASTEVTPGRFDHFQFERLTIGQYLSIPADLREQFDAAGWGSRPVTLPDWVPPNLRQDLSGGRLADGVYRDRYTAPWPSGYTSNVVVWVRGRDIQIYQEFPTEPSFYEIFAAKRGLSGWQANLLHQVFTEYNQDMWSLIDPRRHAVGQARSPEYARSELRTIYGEVLKGVLLGSAALLASGAGISAVNQAGSAGRMSTSGRPKVIKVPGGEPELETALPPWVYEAIERGVEAFARTMKVTQ